MTRYHPTSDRQFRHDDRGVSEVLGAILVFALLILLLVLIQANAVPAANQQVEFEHNQRVVQDFQSLQDGLFRASATGQEVAIPVETGVSYPPRFFLLNPGPATGTIRTTGQQSLTIDNAQATGNVGDFWNGSLQSYETTGLTYEPQYNELQRAGTLHLEHSMLYRSFDSGNRYFDDPTGFIDGNRIRLTLLSGEFSRSSLSESVEIAPVSHQRRTITVQSTAVDPITITFETDLEPDTILDGLGEDTKVKEIRDNENGTATMELSPGSYELTMSKIRVGSTSVSQPPSAYITDVAGNGTQVPSGTTQRLVAEVRDRYNNPVSNVEVSLLNADSLDGSVEFIDGSRTDSEGRVTVAYTAPPREDLFDDTNETVRIGIEAATGPANRTAFQIGVIDRTPASVTVRYPNGGETFEAGSTYPIDWSTTGSIDLNSVVLSYSTNGGNTWTEISSDGVNDGTHDWDIPDSVRSTNALVRVTVRDTDGNQGTDISDGQFEIVEPSDDGDESNADVIRYIDGSGSAETGADRGIVTFGIENTGSTAVPITGLGVDTSKGGISGLREDLPGTGAGNNEVFINVNSGGTDGFYEVDGAPTYTSDAGNRYPLNTQVTLSEAASLPGGGTATVTLAKFVNNGNKVPGESLAGDEFTITLYFGDGTSKTVQFTG